MLSEFDPSEPDVLANPYASLKDWRERDPIHWNPVLQRWMVLRHRDVQRLCRHPTFSSRSRNARKLPALLRWWLKPLLNGILNSMLFQDAPEHTRLRQSVNTAFLPKIMADLAPKIEKTAHELLDKVAAQGRMDLIAAYAFPLPVIVISELLGVAPEDRALFRKWSNSITAIVVRPKVGLKDLLRANASAREMRRYFDKLFALRRAEPREDLVSHLLRLPPGSLNADELFSMCMLILIAGHETTTNMIGLSVKALLENPDELARLRADPTLMDRAVDELLRYDSSVQALARVCIEDTELDGKAIKKGDTLMLSLAAANRDPEFTDDPDRLRLDRGAAGGVTFGHGPHFCLGAALTKLEMKIALGALFARFPNLKLEPQDYHWVPALSHRGLHRLNVSF
jgi:hypothetical protein